MTDQAHTAHPFSWLGLVDHHCHSVRADWAVATREGETGGRPGWRQCFTEAPGETVVDSDVPDLLGYRRFLAALDGLLAGREQGVGADPHSAPPAEPRPAPPTEADVLARRDRAAGEGYLRGLFDDAGIRALLVDTGFGASEALGLDELRRTSRRDVREVVRLESVAETVLAGGGLPARSLAGFVDAVGSVLAAALDGGAVAIKSIMAYRTGLHLPDTGPLAHRQAFTLMDRRRQAQRFDDPVLVPALVRRTAELAAERGVPFQFHTGFGDPDIDLPAADPALMRPLFLDSRTEACPVVLLHCYPYVRAASYLAGTYPQVFMDLSLTIPLAEPVAATVVREALALCPPRKLLAASDGHSYPEMHWWGAVVWRRALREVLDAELASGALDERTATDMAARILAGNARRLYELRDP